MNDDQQLLKALREGSETAFRTLVNQYQPQSLNTALGFVPNLQDAEDITQEVFVEVYRSVSNFRGDAQLSTWIYRITVTKALEHLRHRKRKKRMAYFRSLIGLEDRELKAPPDTFNHPGVQLENKERTEILHQHISQLPDNQRTAFILQKIEGKSQKEISTIMEISESAIESLLFRAKKTLKKELTAYYRNTL